MKKLFLAVIVTVTFSTNTMADSKIRTMSLNKFKNAKVLRDCNAIVSDFMAIHEEFFGCLETDQYTKLYNFGMKMCTGDFIIRWI